MKNFEFIFAAYALGWGVFFVYYLMVARRLRRAEEELRRLKETQESREPSGAGRG